MPLSTYAIALGSNRPTKHGSPWRTVEAALRIIRPDETSPIIGSAPLGPSSRTFANAAAILGFNGEPDALLEDCKDLERQFGRRPGRRWGARPLDIDIILWSEGCWRSPKLIIPHPRFRERGFVLQPLAMIAPDLRDPLTKLTVAQLLARLTRRRPVPSSQGRARGP